MISVSDHNYQSNYLKLRREGEDPRGTSETAQYGLSVRLDWCPSKSAGLETRDASPTTEHTAHPTGAPPAAQDPASVGLSAAP
eukprot:3814356-Rhodomonas_salina.1